MKLVLIRRPDTRDYEGPSGRSASLSPEGQDQLSHDVEICRAEGVEAVAHSLLPRAVVGAEALAQELNVPCVAQKGLQERDFGDWDNWDWARIAAELDTLSTAERYSFVPPNGESWQQMEERLLAALGELAKLEHSCVAIVTHWGPIRALLPALSSEPKESTLNLNVENGQTFTVDYLPLK